MMGSKSLCRVLALGLALGVVSVQAQLEGQAVRGFRLPEYDDEGRLTQQLFGETATFLADGIIQLTGLRLEIYREGEITARIYSPACAYDPNRRRAASHDHIRIVTPRAVVTGDGFAWNAENEQFQIFRNAKIVFESDEQQDLLRPRGASADEDVE